MTGFYHKAGTPMLPGKTTSRTQAVNVRTQWLEAAVERVRAGELACDVMADYGYYYINIPRPVADKKKGKRKL